MNTKWLLVWALFFIASLFIAGGDPIYNEGSFMDCVSTFCKGFVIASMVILFVIALVAIIWS